MKTIRYYQSYEKIIAFLKLANDGIVVAEINDEITRNEFLSDLRDVFPIVELKLKEMSTQRFIGISQEILNGSVVVLNSGVDFNIENTAINLNYNRDWFLSLHAKIVLVIPSSLVERLIEFSFNFWSCVALHERFNPVFPCIVYPMYIGDTIDLYNDNSGAEQNKKYVANLLSNIWDKYFILSDNKSMISFLKEEFDASKTKNSDEQLYNRIMKSATILYEAKMYSKAKVCYNFIYNNLLCFCQSNDLRKISFLNEVAKNDFKLKKFNSSVYALARIGDLLDETSNDNVIRSANKNCTFGTILNNIGVNFYYLDKLKSAQEYIYKAYTDLDDFTSPENESMVLFNLSIIAYVTGAYHEAKQHIREAINCVSGINSRWYKIICSRYRVFYSYILINYGDVVEAENTISSALSYLRDVFDENHLYILEAHYVYSLFFLYTNQLDRAFSCAYKALEIANNLNEKFIKPDIWALLGEICYEQKDYKKAKVYLSRAYARNKVKKIFSEEFMEWLRRTIDICKTEE